MGSLPKKKGYWPEIISVAIILSVISAAGSAYWFFKVANDAGKVSPPVVKNKQEVTPKSDGAPSAKP